MDEREVGGPVAQGLDHGRVVRGHRDAHRHPHELAERLAEVLPGGQEVGRLLRRREHEMEAGGGAG
jgi:hypothetical protein